MNAVKILIADKNTEWVQKEKDLLEAYFQKHHRFCKINTCSDESWALLCLKEEVNDIYILGIQPPDFDGIKIGREIRRYSQDPFIIYVAPDTSCMQEAFEVEAYRFYTLPEFADKLDEMMDELLPALSARLQDYFDYESNREVWRIPLSEILYLKSDGKYVDLHYIDPYDSTCKILRFRSSLSKLPDKLSSRDFCHVSRYYVVNLANVTGMENSSLSLRGGVTLPVSRSRSREIRNHIAFYWEQHRA